MVYSATPLPVDNICHTFPLYTKKQFAKRTVLKHLPRKTDLGGERVCAHIVIIFIVSVAQII